MHTKWALLLSVCLALGCTSSHCDPDQLLADDLCLDISSVDGGSCQPADDAGDGFGISCVTTSDCPCGFDYCLDVDNGGSGGGYCTKSGCGANASLCPATWSCIDYAEFISGLPSVCTRSS